MKRILILFASRHGQTEKIVRRISDVLRDTGAFVDERVVSSVDDLTGYDEVVVAGPVYYGEHPKPLVEFVQRHVAKLSQLPSAFVSVSGAAKAEASRGVAAEAAQKFVAETGWTPDRIELVAGGEPYTRYGFFTKWIMRRIARKQGRVVNTKQDYEFTDWAGVDRFAATLVG